MDYKQSARRAATFTSRQRFRLLVSKQLLSMNLNSSSITTIVAAACLLGLSVSASADEVRIAVAANFIAPLQELAGAFEASTGHTVEVSAGSTGQLYAQIANGAPFDVLLAADQSRPRLLAEEGFGDIEGVFTYAIGHLALWSAQPQRIDEFSLAELLDDEFRWFAIAEPEVAPYGTAARQVLESLGVWGSIQPRLVRGQNIAQTFAMIETGNAELGLIALSQALSYRQPASYISIAQELHDPIRQDAILLNRGRSNDAARAFLAFLQSAAATEIIEDYGYSIL
jgi:molybdate transport system substrate-binding protein